MVNHLLIDIGNTCLKWAVYAADTNHCLLQDKLAVTQLTHQQLQQQWQTLPACDNAWLCSVGQQITTQICMDVLQTQLKLPTQQIYTTTAAVGVSNAYQQPEQLGVDRWMALLGARQHSQQNSIIVSCGTATTIDVINHHGQHQGGYILPSLYLMQQSLAQSTADKSITVQVPTTGLALANNTCDAITHGTQRMLSTLIQQLYQEQQQPALLLTGGDAEILAACLNIPYQTIPNLVFLGMLALISA